MKLLRCLLVILFFIPVIVLGYVYDIARFLTIRYYCLLIETFRELGVEDGKIKLAKHALKAYSMNEKEVDIIRESVGEIKEIKPES